MGTLIDKTKGRIKQAIGDLTGNDTVKREGERDEAKGKLEGAVEGVKGAAKDVKGAVEDAGKAIKTAVK